MQKSMIRLVSFADLFSIFNALFGFLAISVLLIENLEIKIHISLSLILIGLLIDGLDGIIARKFGSSNIGEYLESMADMTTLSVAPAIFVFYTYIDVVAVNLYRYVYLVFALVLFLGFAIIRLASFHIMKKEKIFVGLPASVSTVILLILAYFEIDFILILPAVVIIGALMASNICFPKPDIRVNGFAAVFIVLTIVFNKSYYGFAPILLFIGILIYSIGGPIYLKFFKKQPYKPF